MVSRTGSTPAPGMVSIGSPDISDSDRVELTVTSDHAGLLHILFHPRPRSVPSLSWGNCRAWWGRLQPKREWPGSALQVRNRSRVNSWVQRSSAPAGNLRFRVRLGSGGAG